MTSDLRWFKSSYSDGGGGQCVEAAYTWHQPARPAAIHVRDSKQTDGPLLAVTPTAWTTFLTGARRG
ncbi:DUF397 domain-containing protein [Streptomyces griseoluteus]|uniref:DUF397 domain-containing protein n=1 Tax=Streptomyces griseoluteus TaxID=29306 RepID=UPI0037FEB198